MEVRIVSKKLIKPSVPTPSHLRSMRLSFMDTRLPPRTVPLIFYYPAAHGDYHCPTGNIERRKLLEKSLSEILTLYYPFGGRFVKENLTINCNDEGVEYAEAVVNGQLSQILEGQFEVWELNRFLPDQQAEESATTSIVAVQVNIFDCGGLAIGLLFSHRIMDGFTCCMFTNCWAKACKLGINDGVVVPNFELGVLFPPKDTAIGKLPSLSTTTSEAVTRRFLFDGKTISKLKAEVVTGSVRGHKHKSSTSEVLIALIWRAQIKAASARYGFQRNSLLSVAVNLRGKTFKKIPENCCGNIYTLVTARFQADDHEMRILGLNDFVDKVRDAVKNTIMEFGEENKDEDDDDDDDDARRFFKLITRPVIEIAEEAGKGDGDVHRFSSLRNFPFYQVDFGWGEPAWVSIAQRPYKGVMLLDTKSGDGMEAWVTMDKEEMAHFQNDPSITMYSSAFPNIIASKI